MGRWRSARRCGAATVGRTKGNDVALRTASICTGYGGLELGLQLAGAPIRSVVAIERQAYAGAVLASRMETGDLDPCLIWDDLESFDVRPWRGLVDLVTAGFPCQGASVAGKRKGTGDERWLWPRVWRTTLELGAGLLFIENVPGLLTVNGGSAFGEIVSALAARGWIAEWDCVPAGAIGAPHVRDRIFLLATDPHRLELREQSERDQRERRSDGATQCRDREPVHAGRETWGGAVPSLCGVDDGDPAALERSHLLGNGVVPQAAAAAWSVLWPRLFG